MPGLTDRYLSQATLQGRRWMVERRREAVEQNDVNQLAELLANQKSARPREMTSALEIAVMKKSDDFAECVRLLLESGADASGKNGGGTPFLLLAIEAGCLHILQHLVAFKCSLDQPRLDGATALHRAASRGHVTCLRALVQAGADVNVRDAQNRTPLIVACQGDLTEVALILVDAGSDVNVADERGRSAVFWVAAYNNQDLLKALLERHCDIDIQGPGHMSPLMIAAAEGNRKSLRRLLVAGADTDLLNCDHQTALLLAAKQNELNCVEDLVKAGCDVNVRDDNEATAAVYVTHACHVIEAILDAGGDPEVQTKQHTSPLWLAAHGNHVDTAILLLRANCDPITPGGPHGKRPLQVALYSGHVAMVKILLIASVAMVKSHLWIQDYLADDNLRDRALANPDVNAAISWLEDYQAELCAREPPRLKTLSRLTIRTQLGRMRVVARAQQLPLPLGLRDYVGLAELLTFASDDSLASRQD